VALVFASYIPTAHTFEYKSNPRDYVHLIKDFYVPDNKFNQDGDGTVTATSSIIPAIKWISVNMLILS